jgi:hypothetical protein
VTAGDVQRIPIGELVCADHHAQDPSIVLPDGRDRRRD